VRAWVIAAGNGHEAYSVACLLRSRFPEKVITVFAHDADLLNISSASTLTVDPKTAPGAIAQHLVEGSRGFVFSDEIRQSISFEYHDVLHDNTFPQVHLIVAKDYLSFLAEIPRKKLMDDIHEKISERGIVLVGANEVLPDGTYEPIASGPVRGFRKLQ
jgi:purine-binding chemotaxis protein CheW